MLGVNVNSGCFDSHLIRLVTSSWHVHSNVAWDQRIQKKCHLHSVTPEVWCQTVQTGEKHHSPRMWLMWLAWKSLLFISYLTASLFIYLFMLLALTFIFFKHFFLKLDLKMQYCFTSSRIWWIRRKWSKLSTARYLRRFVGLLVKVRPKSKRMLLLTPLLQCIVHVSFIFCLGLLSFSI